MEENNLIITEENEKDWKKRFLDFINRFLEIWKRRKDKSSEKSLEDELLEQAKSDEEKKVLKELFLDIDEYHAEMTNVMNAIEKDENLTPGEWMEQQIYENVDNLASKITDEGRKLNEDEKEQLKILICDVMDTELEAETDKLDMIAGAISDLEIKKEGR